MSGPRVALVTGAARGIGLEVCRRLAERGLRVLLTARDEGKARAAAEALGGESRGVVAGRLDVRDTESIRLLAEGLRRDPGRLDVLVNNAGIFVDKDRAAHDVPATLVRETLETNLLGPLFLCQAFVPLMRRQGYGRIVNLSSALGSLAEMGGGYPAYRISKTGLNALTRMLAAELAGSNILVNSVCPGWVKTEMGGPRAERAVEDSVNTILWLATLPDGGPSGGFYRDGEAVPW